MRSARQKANPIFQPARTGFLLSAVVFLLLTISGCEAVESPKGAAYYSKVAAPVKKELRWSNGGTPEHIDPAFAAAPPETDIVRAVYEGLTSLDGATLKALPAAAESWEASEDKKEWTFRLRKDAKWSNGDAVTAEDFIRSWKRLVALRDKAANNDLLRNIKGVSSLDVTTNEADVLADPFLLQADPTAEATPAEEPSPTPSPTPGRLPADTPQAPTQSSGLGFEALDRHTLRISLVEPDSALPRLLADPIFFPIHRADSKESLKPISRPTVTNGPFTIESVSSASIAVLRSSNYWNARSIGLDRIEFVSMPSAEIALQAYRGGKLDVITNANFEPLALKLLAPYEDFRTTVHSALNFYEFNDAVPPFSDRRVRLALAAAIDRDKLAETEMAGSVEPAYSFLPLSESKEARFEHDIEAAKASLAAAGFPDGKDFPTIRLVVNRNNVQQRIARAVAKMWKNDLNIETEIIVKDTAEMRSVRESGDFHLIRRGVVLPSPNVTASLMAIFDRRPVRKFPVPPPSSPAPAASPAAGANSNSPIVSPSPTPAHPITELSAIYDVEAIPLYFPRSYALVQPYVQGFHLNGIDSPSIGSLSVDTAWAAAGVF